MSDPPRRRITPRQLRRPSKNLGLKHNDVIIPYSHYFDSEMNQFFYGDYIHVDGSVPSTLLTAIGEKDQYELEHKILDLVGDRWTVVEKELFFEFLGRYGINNIERIKYHLPRKSVLEIKTYYDLLKQATEDAKRTNKRFSEIDYAEIPAAIEVDEVFVNLENEISKRLKQFEENQIKRKYRKESYKEETITMNHVQRDILPKSIINYEALEKLCAFYRKNVKCDGILNDDTRLHYSFYDEMETRVEMMIRDLIKEIILIKLHRGSKTQVDYQINEKGEEILILPIPSTHVMEALKNLKLNRPKGLQDFFNNELLNAIDCEVIDEDYVAPEYKHVIFDSQNRSIRSFVKSLNFEGFFKPRREPKEDSFKIKELQDLIIEKDEINPEGRFIIDDFEQDKLLDDETSWFLLSIENQRIDEYDEDMRLDRMDPYLEALSVEPEPYKAEYISGINDDDTKFKFDDWEYYEDHDYFSDLFLEEMEEDEVDEMITLEQERIKDEKLSYIEKHGKKRNRSINKLMGVIKKQKIETNLFNGYELSPESIKSFSVLPSPSVRNPDKLNTKYC